MRNLCTQNEYKHFNLVVELTREKVNKFWVDMKSTS